MRKLAAAGTLCGSRLVASVVRASTREPPRLPWYLNDPYDFTFDYYFLFYRYLDFLADGHDLHLDFLFDLFGHDLFDFDGDLFHDLPGHDLFNGDFLGHDLFDRRLPVSRSFQSGLP